MRLTNHRSLPAAGAWLLASALLAGCEVNLNTEGLSVRETRAFTVAGVASLDLDTFDGAIEIHSWDQAEVEIEVEKRAMEQSLLDQIKVAATQQGDQIVLKVTGPSRTEFSGVTIGVHVSPTARLRVVVPRKTNIVARSGDGSIRAEAIDGKIVLATVDGSVTATRLSGEVQVRSGDGAIRLDQVAGKFDLETDDGSIGFEGNPSVLRLKTGDGSVRAQIDVDTVMIDNWDLTTGDGSITLTLPAVFNAELDAETSDGVVRSSHPLLDDDSDERRRGEDGDERRERRRILRTRIGDGGKVIRVRTGDGTIRIER